MKKTFYLIFLSLLLVGCEKKFDNVVNAPLPNYRVEYISNLSSFKYSPSDSNVTLYLKVSSTNNISEVTCSVYDPDGNELATSPIQLLDNGDLSIGDTTKGDGVYTNKFPLNHSEPIGKYSVKYFIQDNSKNTKLAAVQYFSYDNGQTNEPPVLSNLIMSDSIGFDQTFTFSVKVTDPNGYSDISQVYYELYRPDGTQVTNSQGISKFPMYDNGDTAGNGDVTKGDGIFTFKLSFPSGQQMGTWKFIFKAVDRSGATSNVITHNIVVK